MLWRENRLLTLTGPGGIGKTRLAAELLARSPDRENLICEVDFVVVSDPALTVSALARKLQVMLGPGTSGPDAINKITTRLRQEPGILFLDTCDRVTGPLRELLGQLLEDAPDVHVLATSQVPLSVHGEQAWRVPGLAYQVRGRGGTVTELDAVRYFLARVREKHAAFQADDAILGSVQEICRRLDGSPLALGLVGSSLNVYSPDEVLRRWENLRGSFLSIYDPGARSDRQSSLASAIDWSAGLLSSRERDLVRELSVFAGYISIEDIAGVLRDISREDITAGVIRLCDLSWLEQEAGQGPRRFRMPDTLRAWADRRLTESGRSEAAYRAHATYYAALCAAAAADHFRADRGGWPTLIEQATPNIQAALSWCLTGSPETGAQLATSLLEWWRISNRLRDGDHWYRQYADRALPDRLKARIACAGALLAMDIDNYNLADIQASAALPLLQQQEDWLWAGRALTALHTVAKARDGRFEDARAYLYRALDFQRRHGDAAEIDKVLNNLGSLASDMADTADRDGDPARAEEHRAEAEQRYRDSLKIKRAEGNPRSIAIGQANLADIITKRGHPEEALEILKDAEHTADVLKDKFLAAFISNNIGENRLLAGKYAQAESAFRQTFEYGKTGDVPRFHGLGALGLGRALCKAKRYAEGVASLELAAKIGREHEIQEVISAARVALDELPPEAFDFRDERAHGLTLREREVLRAYADDPGRAGSSHARQLGISLSTWDNHKSRIREKLHVPTMGAAVNRARELGLL